MAKIGQPGGTKGNPPSPSQPSRNLTKRPDDELVPLNFKLPAGFKREFKQYATAHDITMAELLRRCFDFYRQQ